MQRSFAAFLVLCFFVTGCYRVPDRIEPSFQYAVQDKYIQSLPSCFPPLTTEELSQPYGHELLIALKFAKQLELYQAITSFKRAEILLPEDSLRLEQIQYGILLCYYMGRKWDDVLYTFNQSKLRYATVEFPAFHDLIVVLYDTYKQLGNEAQAEQMMDLMRANYPEDAQSLMLGTALSQGDIEVLTQEESRKPFLTPLLTEYESQKKRVGKAQGLNALIPGAGYLYLGQKQSALTAFLLNSLFIGASVYFFETGNIAAGAIFTTFEAGWYFGGIYGVGLEAKSYNERIYESLATPIMYRQGLFPALRIHCAF